MHSEHPATLNTFPAYYFHKLKASQCPPEAGAGRLWERKNGCAEQEEFWSLSSRVHWSNKQMRVRNWARWSVVHLFEMLESKGSFVTLIGGWRQQPPAPPGPTC